MIRETRNSHQISPWVLIFQRMNNKWTLYLLLLLRPTSWFWWFMHEYPAVTLARWQPEKQNWKGEIKGSQEQWKRGLKASTAENCLSMYILELQVSFIELAPNNYLKASLWSLDNWDCPCFVEKPPRALNVPLQWACCTSPELCPEPHQRHFPAFVPTSAQNCRSRCCLLDWQTSVLWGGGGETVKPSLDIIQYTFVLLITGTLLWSISNGFIIAN